MKVRIKHVLDSMGYPEYRVQIKNWWWRTIYESGNLAIAVNKAEYLRGFSFRTLTLDEAMEELKNGKK